jgi:hypothetical protein
LSYFWRFKVSTSDIVCHCQAAYVLRVVTKDDPSDAQLSTNDRRLQFRLF